MMYSVTADIEKGLKQHQWAHLTLASETDEVVSCSTAWA